MKTNERRFEGDNLILPPGHKLGGGRIVIQEALGNGGFGITYKARHRDYGEVALKEFMPRSMVYGRGDERVSVLQDKRSLFDKCMRQFQRESRILRSLKHPNIVRVLDDFEENGTAYYVMELLEGQDLASYMRSRGKALSPQETCEILMPIINALEYLHGQKVLHRDISPDNVYLCRAAGGGVVPCLIDFGAAFSAQRDFTHTFPRVKKSGYSPLEQTWDDKYQGTWSDVYSLCATFYYAVTGTAPVPSSDRGVGSNDAMKRPRELNSAVSPELDEVLMHGLALSYTDRIRQMTQLRMEIARATGYTVPKTGGAPSEPVSGRSPFPDEPDRPDTPQAPEGPGGAPEGEDISILNGQSDPVGGTSATGGASIGALLLDWMICWAMPATIIGLLAGPGVGILAGAAISIVLNGLLAAGGGTVGQRLLGIGVRAPGTGAALGYSFLRHVVPVALIDEVMALQTGRHFIEETAFGAPAAQDVANEESNVAGISRVMADAGAPRAAASGPEAVLRCVDGIGKGRAIRLRGVDSLLFGRDPKADVSYPPGNNTISTHHCSVGLEKDGWHVTDLRSTNGTFLNGEPLKPFETSRALRRGDKLSIANRSLFVYEEGGATPPADRR